VPSPRAGAIIKVHRCSETHQILCAVIVFREALVKSTIDGEDTWTFDNTFGTNNQGMKLGLLTGITRNRRGRIMGMSWMGEETVDNFKWVLVSFESIYGRKPGVLFTDGCVKLLAAIRLAYGVTWAAAFHLLCIWHLSNNVYDHIRYLFGATVRGKKAVCDDATRKWVAFNRTRILQQA
jgi:hypothetical protein